MSIPDFVLEAVNEVHYTTSDLTPADQIVFDLECCMQCLSNCTYFNKFKGISRTCSIKGAQPMHQLPLSAVGNEVTYN